MTEPTPGSEARVSAFDPEPETPCGTCGKTRPHTIQRINLLDRPTLCDPCFEERVTKRSARA